MNAAAEALVWRGAVRAGRGLVAGVVLFWLGAMFFVRGEEGVPTWWLPTALLVGFCLPWPPAPELAGPRVAAPWSWLAAIVLLAALFAVSYGALATPSRHWDGAAAFDAKVHWLVHAPTLQQPFFADPAVFHHSPDYPLLLPLLVASTERLLGGGLGRLWLPGVYVAWLLVLATALVRAGTGRRLTLAVVVAAGLSPALLGPGGGAVDSGYSDPLLLLATTAIAAGLLQRAPFELAIGVLLALASKPEGVGYAGIAALVAFVCGRRSLLFAVLAAMAIGAVVWLPVQRQLLHAPALDFADVCGVLAVLAGAGAAALGVDALAQRTRSPVSWRWLTVAAMLLAVLLLVPWLAEVVPANGAIGIYLHRGAHWQQGLANVPAIAAEFVEHTLLRVHFGATFVLALLLLVWRGAPRDGVPLRDGAADGRAAAAFLVLGLLTTALPFVLTHENDVRHHLKSSMPRLLLHWLGPAWLFIACRLAPLLSPRRAGAVGAAAPS